MQASKKLSPLWIAIVLCILTLSSVAQQSAKGKSAEAATLALMQMHSNYQQVGAAQKSQMLAQFSMLAAQRQQLLSSLIQTNPADVLRVAIPSNIRNTMPAQVQGFVETDSVAQGVLDVLVEMNGTPNRTTGTQMHYGLTMAQQHLGLHFAANEPENLLTGSVVRVHGVQVGSDLALASGKPSTSTTTSSLQVVSAALAPAATGGVSTLVILVNFQDNPTAQPWTPSAVQSIVYSDQQLGFGELFPADLAHRRRGGLVNGPRIQHQLRHQLD